MRLTAIGTRVFLVVVLAGLIPAGVFAGAQGQAPSAKSFALRHSVVVIGPNSPLFESVLEKDFPGVTSVNYFQKLKPLLAIIHNSTRRVVKAYVVKWIITNSDSSTSTAMLPVMQEPAEFPLLTGQETVLGPAGSGRGTELVSPYFVWTRGRFQAYRVAIPFSASARKPLVAAAQTAERIETTLDGTIFGDGVFVGPDTSKLYERFQAEQQAEVDEANWLIKALTGGMELQEVRDKLSEQVYAGVNSIGINPPSLYTAALGRQASRFLDLLDYHGQAVAQKTAAMQASAAPLKLRKLIPGQAQ